MNKKIILPIFLIIVLATIGLAIWNWNVSVIVNVVPGSCYDSDNGANYELKGNASALLVIPNYYPPNTNSTLLVNAEDTCQGDVLFEVVCGLNFGYAGLGGLLSLNCSDLNTANETYSCQLGACVNMNTTLPPTNNTNLTLYDDFSSGVLNLSKWIETPTPGTQFTDEHYINNLTGKYHISQNTQAHRGTMLTFNRTFSSGDILSYELTFNNATGNAQHGCRINGNYCSQSGIVPNPTPNPGSGMIGYWNGLSDVGNLIGKYIITEQFNTNSITQIIIRPDDTTVSHTYMAVSTSPYVFKIFSHTGSDGKINTDIDNVYIYTNQNNTNQTNSTLPLVALWHFNEGNGTITLDASGNGNTGTINGAIWTTGYSGNALDFDGSNDLVTTIHTPSIDVTNEIEIEAWVRHDASGYGTIVSKNGPYLLAIYNNKIHGGVYSNDGLSSGNTWTEIDGTTNLQVGTWYKLKMKYDGSTVKLYVNDILENSATKIGQMPVVSQNLNIGWGDPGQNYYFNGIIDEISIRGN